MESIESWQAMKQALGKPANRGRVLRLADTGPGSTAGITRSVHVLLEQHTVPKQDTNPRWLAEAITTAVLNRLGAGVNPGRNGDDSAQ